MTYQSRGTVNCVNHPDRKAIGRKLCRSCYTTLHRKGGLGQYPILGPEDVFMARVEKTDSCWVWQGSRNGYGYGVMMLPGGKMVRAHRYSYERFKGPIPNGMVIMHSCDNPPCVNPDHLNVGTKADNNADTAKKNRHNYGTDHWNGRLSRQAIADILASTDQQSVLARRYGVCQSHISRIKSGFHRRNG
jgi:hypothetical protein